MEGRWFLFSLSLTLLVTAANLTALQGRSRSDFIQTVGRYQEWEQEEVCVQPVHASDQHVLTFKKDQFIIMIHPSILIC